MSRLHPIRPWLTGKGDTSLIKIITDRHQMVFRPIDHYLLNGTRLIISILLTAEGL